jgi:hypothetical protein
MPPKKKPRVERKNLYDNFQQGDLVFGLNSFLSPVHNELSQRGFRHYYCNSLNSTVVPAVVLDSPYPKKLDKAQNQHYQFLGKHKEYLQRASGKPILSSSLEPHVSAAFRRACKLLLINRDSERNHMAHVVLGDIDWSLVCDKTNQGITNSELRAAYRDISLHGNHPNILFYNKNLELSEELPWNEDCNKKIFEDYEKARVAKRSYAVSTDSGTDTTETEATQSDSTSQYCIV